MMMSLITFAPFSPERHADADFTRAANHFVRKQAVKADAGEQQRQQTKKACQACNHALLRHEAFNAFRLGAHRKERKIAIQALREVAHGGDQSGRIQGGADLEMSSATRQRNVERRGEFRGARCCPSCRPRSRRFPIGGDLGLPTAESPLVASLSPWVSILPSGF